MVPISTATSFLSNDSYGVLVFRRSEFTFIRFLTQSSRPLDIFILMLRPSLLAQITCKEKNPIHSLIPVWARRQRAKRNKALKYTFTSHPNCVPKRTYYSHPLVSYTDPGHPADSLEHPLVLPSLPGTQDLLVSVEGHVTPRSSKDDSQWNTVEVTCFLRTAKVCGRDGTADGSTLLVWSFVHMTQMPSLLPSFIFPVSK